MDPIFSESTYKFLSGEDIADIKSNTEEISDPSIKMIMI